MATLGQGSIGRNNKPAAAGAPFSTGSANNGLSVDATSGKIVLGNDVGDATEPAQLLADRIIPMKGQRIVFAGITPSVVVQEGFVNIDGDESAGRFGQLALTDVNAGGRSFGALISQSDQAGVIPYVNGFTQTCIHVGIGRVSIDNSFTPPVVVVPNALLQVEGAIASGDPGSGRAAWNFGTVQAAAVALDAAHFVEVMINGVVVKLAIVT